MIDKLLRLGVFCRRHSFGQIVQDVLHAHHIYVGRFLQNLAHIKVIRLLQNHRVLNLGVLGHRLVGELVQRQHLVRQDADVVAVIRRLGAGAFLFTTRRNFEATGGFDEQYFAGEEVYFSLALRKLGRFKVLREPVVTSGRKLRMYSAKEILGTLFIMIFGGPRMVRSRARLNLWYDGKRETEAACE